MKTPPFFRARSPAVITNPEKMVAELDDPYILIHEKKLSSLQAMLLTTDVMLKTIPRGPRAARKPQRLGAFARPNA